MRLPYTVGLVLTGIDLAGAGLETGAMLTHDLIFEVVLPPLLFEAALSIRWRELRQDMRPVVVLSTLGVVISAVVVAAGMVKFSGGPAAPALVFGVLIAATDPIAVLAMFKDTGIKGRLRHFVESESVFNDGVATVLFALVITWAQATDGSQLSTVSVGRALAFMTGGGILVGVACGAAAITLAGRTSDHLVEATLTAVAARRLWTDSEACGLRVDRPCRSQRRKHIASYEEGLSRYRRRDFSGATIHFDAVLSGRPHDWPASPLLERCKRLRQSGVDEEWSSVATLKAK
jgi:NhaP-type Na+/H+ or K+/H+ antiporter